MRKMLIRNCCCEVGLSTAVFANQDEPSLRVLSILKRYLVRLLYPGNARIKVLEALIAECIKVRHLTQLPPTLLFTFSFFAFAGNRLAKIRMPVGNINTQITGPFANGANTWGYRR